MKDEGLLTREQEKVVVGLLDDLIKGNAITEPISDLALKILVPMIDNNFLSKAIAAAKLDPEDIANLQGAIDAVFAKDYEKAGDHIADLADAKIDVPLLDDVSENILFKSLFGILVAAIQTKVNKESQPSAPGT